MSSPSGSSLLELPFNPLREAKYNREREDYVPPAVGSPEAVYFYMKMRWYADKMKELEQAIAKLNREALLEMQAAWRECNGAEPGVYSFKEWGRTVVVVGPKSHPVDYPPLIQLVK